MTEPACNSSGPMIQMPTAEIDPAAEVMTTWGVLQGYQTQIEILQDKVAALMLERDALQQRAVKSVIGRGV